MVKINIERTKVHSPDYVDKTTEEAIIDFENRIK